MSLLEWIVATVAGLGLGALVVTVGFAIANRILSKEVSR